MYTGIGTEPPYTADTLKEARNYRNHFGTKAVRGMTRMASLMRNEFVSETCMQQATYSFCKHMFTLLDMVKKAHTLAEAWASIRVLNIAKLLFSNGICIHVACPVDELFRVEYARVFAIVFDAMQGSNTGNGMGASDTATDVSQDTEWDELQDDLDDEAANVTRETDWKYDRDDREWKPKEYALATPCKTPDRVSDDDSLDEEEKFLHGLAAAQSQRLKKEKMEQAEAQARTQKKPSAQPTLGVFFGNAVTKKYAKVTLPDGREQRQLVSAEVSTLPTTSVSMPSWAKCCPNGCGKRFEHGPALTAHLKACAPISHMLIHGDADNSEQEQAGDEPVVETPEAITEEWCIAECPDAETSETEQQQQEVGRKRRKHGAGFKQSGLQQGERRGRAHTLHFKYEVVQHYLPRDADYEAEWAT